MKTTARCTVWLLWAAGAFLLLYPPVVRGLKMSPCGNDGLQEIVAGKITHFTCEAEGAINWRISPCPCRFCRPYWFEAECYRKNCDTYGVSKNTFKTGFIDTNFTYISIDAANNTDIYDNEKYVNETLYCFNGEISHCGLNYISPSQDVSCVADIASWSVSVSCVIGSAYSSRGIYKCQLFRLTNGAETRSLEVVKMVTSPTSERITRGNVKVSGSCQFNTTLPAEEGFYHFFVSVSPGGRNYTVKLPSDNEGIAVERPQAPSLSCGSRPSLTEGDDSSCTCNATSLGQPTGYLRLSVEDETNQERLTTDQLAHTSQSRQSLTLSLHSRPLLRCDIVWGQEEISGELAFFDDSCSLDVHVDIHMLMKMWKMGFMRKLYILFLLLLGSSRATDIRLSCGNDGMREIAAGQVTNFTCTVAAKTTVRWNLSVHDTGAHELLALCDGFVCNIWPYDERLFKARILNSLHTTMAVDAMNTSIYNSIHRLNGTLYCYSEDGFNRFTIASCELNYIIPPEDVLCRAVNTSWTVNVSCVIGSLYSSRSIYKCKLLRIKLGSRNETLESITMVTTPTSKRITRSEVKMSGSCQFITTLPAEEGKYNFYVSVTPGGHTYSTAGAKEWISVEQPLEPEVYCDPQSGLLQNNDVICTCNTSSMGQPPGFLGWSTGNGTNLGLAIDRKNKIAEPLKLYYKEFRSLMDDDTAWVKCGITWGTTVIQREINISAVVGKGTLLTL